jgi:hypothetical protein
MPADRCIGVINIAGVGCFDQIKRGTENMRILNKILFKLPGCFAAFFLVLLNKLSPKKEWSDDDVRALLPEWE